jgi:hypothetical protein
MRRASAPAAFLVLALASTGAGQEPGPYAHYAKGVAALEAKDPKRATAELAIAVRALPDQPDVLYTLSKAEALSGDAPAALAHLGRVVAMGYATEAASDPAFASLAGLPGFRSLAPAIAENAKPVANAAPAFTLPEADLIPEGIAWDSRGRRLFVGSLAKRKIVAVSSKGEVRDFVPSGRDGMALVLGMKVDPARSSLWACTADGDPAEGENTARRSALFRFDLETGKTLQKIPSPAGGRHLFNDLALADDGTVYLTDSEAGAVYRLPPGAEAVDALAPSGTLVYPNGIALSDDGRLLYVAHDSGIRVWDLARRRDFPLTAPDAVTLAGIDGLSFHGGALVAVQNGLPPHRVVLFTLGPSGDRVTGLRVLERGNPLFEIPTTGAVAGDAYYFMANTQLRALGPGGVVKEPEKRKPVVILKLDLPR